MLDVSFVPTHPSFELPKFGTPGSAGFDLQFWPADMLPVTLEPGQRILLPLGFVIELPEGTELQLRPRSGLAFKNGITVLNSPATIDSDYRGDVRALLVNHSAVPFEFTPGMRICQGVIQTLPKVSLKLAEAVTVTARGAGGFGSTGV